MLNALREQIFKLDYYDMMPRGLSVESTLQQYIYVYGYDPDIARIDKQLRELH